MKFNEKKKFLRNRSKSSIVEPKKKEVDDTLIDQIFNAKHNLWDHGSDQKVTEADPGSPDKKTKREDTELNTWDEYERKLDHANKFNNDTIDSDDDIKKITYKVRQK